MIRTLRSIHIQGMTAKEPPRRCGQSSKRKIRAWMNLEGVMLSEISQSEKDR